MKVAYVLNMPNAANYKVGEMILPQLEEDRHGVEVVGIFFFDDNCLMLQKGNPKGERLVFLRLAFCKCSSNFLQKRCMNRSKLLKRTSKDCLKTARTPKLPTT